MLIQDTCLWRSYQLEDAIKIEQNIIRLKQIHNGRKQSSKSANALSIVCESQGSLVRTRQWIQVEAKCSNQGWQQTKQSVSWDDWWVLGLWNHVVVLWKQAWSLSNAPIALSFEQSVHCSARITAWFLGPLTNASRMVHPPYERRNAGREAYPSQILAEGEAV